MRGLGADVALESSIWMGLGTKFLLQDATVFTTTPFIWRLPTGAVILDPFVLPFCCNVTIFRGPV